MTSDNNKGMRVDRRTTIKWLAATMVATQTACSRDEKYLGSEIPPAPGTSLLGIASPADGVSYGTDPDVMNPVVPWSLTMTEAQLDVTTALCDMILPADDRSPAASSVGVPDFINEWVSAPYPQQQADREYILAGLEWLERQSRSEFDTAFTLASDEQKSTLLDRIAYPGDDDTEIGDEIEFFRRFRFITVGAFYATTVGMEDVGYIGNVAIAGDYPGPSDEALAHLAGVLEGLNLPMPA